MVTKNEFAYTTVLVAEVLELAPLSKGKVDGMENRGMAVNANQAKVAAATLTRVIDGSLFGDPGSSRG